jgi:GT2 family glycosyltransferase
MYALVIPSGSIDNLNQCLAQVVTMEPGDKRVIVVGDGLNWARVRFKAAYCDGEQPFVFARNCNIGMYYAMTETDADGVIILGDDGLVMQPLGLSRLEATARAHPEYGLIAAATNNCGNPNQQWHSEDDLRDEPETVAFICVYIPRSVIETVGYLDERFTGYGYDDDDYCRRVLATGLKIGVYDGCKVNHFALPSVFRNKGIDIETNRRVFEDKWNSE